MQTPPTPPKPPRLAASVAALIGVLAVAVALTVGHLVAGFVGPSASPLLAVGNTAIDLTPLELKDFAVRTFGTYDKLVLLGGMAVVLLGAAVVAGLLSRRSPLRRLRVWWRGSLCSAGCTAPRSPRGTLKRRKGGGRS